MKILVVNTGSTSVKLTLQSFDGCILNTLHSSSYRNTSENPEDTLKNFIVESEAPDVVVHRVVHGGDELYKSQLIDAETLKAIDRASVLAPLHNPLALRWIRAGLEQLRKPHVAVFDTAYFHNLPEVARTYAISRTTSEKLGLRRYGFHGIAHRAMWQRWCEVRPDLPDGGKLISVQLGGGCSITAVSAGDPLDTSMGFSPAEGLVMATRCGDIDPAAVIHLLRHTDMSPDAVEQWLNEEAGLLGLSGKSADMRDLIASVEPQARLAVSLYSYRLRKYIGAYMSVLGGADGVVFSGGVGEHAPEIRDGVMHGMQWCGVSLDDTANRQAVGGETKISATASSVDVRILPADEAAVLAKEAYFILSKSA